MDTPPKPAPLFDAYAADYDAELQRGLAATGEDKEYFARGRIAWLARRLSRLGEKPQTAVDYGCGTSSTAVYLQELAGVRSVVGLDVSRASIDVARQKPGASNVAFYTLDEYRPAAQADLVCCNGVFHHIPPNERSGAVQYVHRTLRPGGWFAFFENNPWNPMTRLMMSRVAFDRDAIMLSALEASRMLEAAGFRAVCRDYLFYFPHCLSWLRRLEPSLARLPLGGQYLVLCRKV